MQSIPYLFNRKNMPHLEDEYIEFSHIYEIKKKYAIQNAS